MTKHSDISVPEGYMSSMQEKLMQIPSRHRPALRTRIAPYLAYAASLVLLVMVGNFILRKTAGSRQDTLLEEWSYASYLAQSLDADGMLPDFSEYTLTEDDIVDYLVDEGLTLEELVSYEESH